MSELSGVEMLRRELFRSNVADAQAALAALAALEQETLRAAEVVSDALLRGRKLLACGNGGSAAAASHFTTELVVRYQGERRAYPGISLCAHGGDLTAIGNDYSFEDTFRRQVEAFGQPGDVLLALSTSGRSENVVRALTAAGGRGLVRVAMLGGDGGRCAGLAEVELCVHHAVTARIQEIHGFLLHTICELVEVRLLAAEQGSRPQRIEALG